MRRLIDLLSDFLMKKMKDGGWPLLSIHLRASGHASEYLFGSDEEKTVELAGPMTVRSILEYLGVKAELVMSVFIDGRRGDMDSIPGQGAEVLLVSPPAGG